MMDAQTATARREQLFTGLVNEHLDEIYNFARYMILDYDDANDIAQKTFLSLYRSLPNLDTEKPLKPWLFKVARNFCLDYLKAKKSVPFSEAEGAALDIPESDAGLEAQLDSELFAGRIRELIGRLPAPYKEVLLLKYFQDFTFGEIASLLGQPENTVKSSFYRGKAKLLELIKANF